MGEVLLILDAIITANCAWVGFSSAGFSHRLADGDNCIGPVQTIAMTGEEVMKVIKPSKNGFPA